MISVLIPTFNYDCRKLVADVHNECTRLGIDFEIRVYDDFSQHQHIKNQNTTLQDLPHVYYKELTENLGFCKIRNLLANDATYENLLFLDADIKVYDNFISKYLKSTTFDVQIGGIQYVDEKPTDTSLYLKWKHGKEREELSPAQRNKNRYRTVSAANIFIKKEIYLKAKMDEEAKGYGYNDTMLGYNLKLINASINHIENPVLHDGLMAAEKFINRSMEAMENLLFFEKQPYIKPDFSSFIKVLKVYHLLHKTKLSKWYLGYYQKNKANWISNLTSNNPNLRNLDKLKLGRLIELKKLV